LFAIPVLRYIAFSVTPAKAGPGGERRGPGTLGSRFRAAFAGTTKSTDEQLATVSVVQREWAAKNPRATFKTPITVEDVLNSRMIAYPLRLLQCA
jgi:acetyl-CoA acetyltransferase